MSKKETFTFSDVIEELRREEIVYKCREKFETLTKRDGVSEEGAFKSIQKMYDSMDLGEGEYSQYYSKTYLDKYNYRFDQLKIYYKNKEDLDLEKKYRPGGKSTPYKFPKFIKNKLKRDLKIGAKKLEKELELREKGNEIASNLKDFLSKTNDKNLINSDEFKRIIDELDEIFNDVSQYENNNEYEKIKKTFLEHNLDVAKDKEVSKRIDDMIELMILNSPLRKNLFIELNIEVKNNLERILTNIVNLPPAEGIQVLNELKLELINLLKKYNMEIKLNYEKLSDSPDEEEIRKYQNNDYRKKLKELIKNMN